MSVSTASPYLTLQNAAAAVEFYRAAFGAEEVYRLTDPNSGLIGHCELKIGNAIFMLSDEFPDFDAVGPTSLGGSPVKFHLFVDNVDTVFQQAIELGASEIRPIKDEFHGSRSGQLQDPHGYCWHIATRQEDINPAEMQRRWNEMAQGDQ